MRRRIHRTTRLGDIITFWTLILVCSVVLFALAFVAGKHWVGGLMARSQSTQAAPQVVLKTPGEGGESSENDVGAGPERVAPPSRVIVKMLQRAPTDAEKNEIEQQYPQDAAGLHKSGQTDQGDESTGGDDKPLGDEAEADSSSQGRYLVAAGSFSEPANAERLLDELKSQGYPAYIVKVTRNDRTLQRVVAGRYAERAKADEVCARLQSQGQEAAVFTQ